MSKWVPEGWQNTTIGDVISDIADGGTPSTNYPEYFGGSIPWVVIDDIQPRIIQTKSTITDLGLRNSSAKLWEKGTIILSIGATIGEVGIIQKTMATKQGICGVVPKDDVSTDYFYHLLVSKKRELNILSQGSTIKETRPPTIKKIQINLPPLPEQKKIASILTSVDEVIETTQKQIDKLQDLKKATMNELLTKGIGHTEFKDSELGRIPKSWGVATINSVTSFIKSGLSRRLSSQDIGIPVINSGNILSTGLDTKELKYWYLDDPQGANIENYLLQDGDILLNFINSVSQIGKSCIYKSLGRDFIYTTNLFCIRVGDKISSSFLHTLMSQERFKKEISLITKPAVNQASFTKEDLSNIIISLPTLEEQNLIMKSLDAIDENITNQHHKLEIFQSLKKSLMQDLLTGKVRVKVS